MSPLKKLMVAVRDGGTTLHVSGADIIIDGADKLSPDCRADLERLHSNGFLWSWSGAGDDDREAIEFGKKLGFDVVLVETADAAVNALAALKHDAGGKPLGLDIETALRQATASDRDQRRRHA